MLSLKPATFGRTDERKRNKTPTSAKANMITGIKSN